MKPAILLIEDEAAIADTLVYALQADGFEVVWRALGQTGLEALRERPFDLLILDVGLPDGSGFELCKEIRKTSEIPLMFLTARSGEIDRVVGLEIGGDDYVPKPFSPREVCARVKTILKRSRGAALPPTLFQVDAEGGRIRYRGRLLPLTRYEFGVLQVLISQPGRIFSRNQLMDRVWGDAEAFDRTVDTHIKTLRAKLHEVDPERDPIATHRGLGYSLQLAT